MAEFFQNKDAVGAREYFSRYLKIRPDVLMEASDVTGECKLCLQAVSVANLELQNYGSCYLDRINDYAQVISYFRKINDIVVRQQMTLQDRKWISQYGVSEIALQAAARIYGVTYVPR